jgi:hypothetical protein
MIVDRCTYRQKGSYLKRKRKPAKKPSRPSVGTPKSRTQPVQRQRTRVGLRRHRQGDCWELVHPHDVLERSADLEEVRQMIDAGEADVATDELRWLLLDCRDFIEAHHLLAELALVAGDLALARAHFGFAYDLGLWALPPEGLKGPLPYRLPANQAFLESAKGLAYCLHELGQSGRTTEVVEKLLQLDPSDPLGVRPMLDAWRKQIK